VTECVVPDEPSPTASGRMLTRRQFVGLSTAVLSAVPSAHLHAAPIRGNAGTPRAAARLILLGTAGGPTPKPNRAAPAQVIVIGEASYVIDCGNGVARRYWPT
jgi:hypothetical protein